MKSFSLIETIIAVSLIVFTITALMQIKDNNMNYLTKFKTNMDNSMISFVALKEQKKIEDTRNDKFYIKDEIVFKDNIASKLIRHSKVNVKDEIIDSFDIDAETFVLHIDIYKQKFTSNNKITSYYKFDIQ